MNADEDRFIRAIAAAPNDEATRLVYADWLEERGESARSTLLRKEVAHFRKPLDRRGAGMWSRAKDVDRVWMAMVSRVPFGILREGLTFKKGGRKPTLATLRALETYWGRPLPPDYAAFLLLHNGGVPSKPFLVSDWVGDVDGQSTCEYLFTRVRFYTTADRARDRRPMLRLSVGEALGGEPDDAFAFHMPIGTLTQVGSRVASVLALNLAQSPARPARVVEISWPPGNPTSCGLQPTRGQHDKETFSQVLGSLYTRAEV
jgi:uncharacterized protein (TIGR02996 family)